jgi:diguanylate cyclase (GGDEF)-like protein/PAS domain S-box-containing protein
MYILFALLIAAFITYLAVGLYAVVHDKKSVLNRVFLGINVNFAIYAIASAFILVAPDKNTCFVWTNIYSIGLFTFSSFILHFFLIFSVKKNLYDKWWVYVLIYLPALFFLVMQFTTGFYAKDYIYTKYGWVLISNTESILFWLFNLQYIVFGVSSIVLSSLKWKNAATQREKDQARTITVSAIITLSISGSLFTFAIFNHNMPNLAPITITLWTLGILYGIVKFKLMVISPEMAAAQILRTISESVVIAGESGDIISANDETISLLGYTKEELKGKNLGDLFPWDDRFKKDNIKNLFNECPIQNMETHFVSKDEKEIPVLFSASECRDDRGELLGFIAASRDVTKLKEAEARLNYLAHHDTLTNLPNRLLFVDRFNQEVAKARRYKTYIAVFLLDLDHFKQVNDQYGHGAGDQLLMEVADRLKASIRQCDSIARLGGDEFVILLSDLKNIEDFKVTAGRIVDNIAKPYIITDKQISVTISVGVSIYPTNGTHLDGLLKNADIAMYSVKSGGRNNYRLFTSRLSAAAEGMPSLENDLKKSFKNKELLLYYQPMVDLYNETIIGVEALIRWDHPKFGVIPPSDFLPQAERSGFIIPLGDWVLESACRQVVKWQQSGFSPQYVSVNLSEQQFNQQNLAEKILGMLEKTQLSPEHLLLEITENSIIRDRENVIKVLKNLYEHKVRVVIAGFGAGYSSLIYLKELPIYAIKIDRFFIRNIPNDPGCATITKAIISLAHDLNIKVIAEGIETKEQLTYLRELEWKPESPIKCDGAQGYLFSEPLSEDSMTELFGKSGD